jgi:hypothetical protein
VIKQKQKQKQKQVLKFKAIFENAETIEGLPQKRSSSLMLSIS